MELGNLRATKGIRIRYTFLDCIYWYGWPLHTCFPLAFSL